MKQNNNEQIVFDMFEEVATESIAEARNAYTYEEIDGCYQEAKEIADKARMNLLEKMGGTLKTKLPPRREYRFYTFGNYCLIVIRCRKSYFLLQI